MSQHTRPLNRQDYKTLTLAALGGALEFYDFIIFVFFAAVVGELFFPADIPEWLRQVQTFGIFAAGYLARPLGGIIMAHFGDLVGRKKMFTLSILLMAIPTLAIGLLPTYASMGILAHNLLLLHYTFIFHVPSRELVRIDVLYKRPEKKMKVKWNKYFF